MTRLALVLAVLALAAPAAAAPHKILVLPVDGTADAATRAKLTAHVVRLARALDGQVTTADTTFADTALAVGCDPQAASCRDEVLASLAVDELVWGTASKDGAQLRVVVLRAARGAALREVSARVAASDAADRIEAGMAPLFTPPAEPAAAPPPPRATEPAPAPSPPVSLRPVPAPEGSRDRTAGVVLAATGGVALGLGLALWASYASQQATIDDHPVNDRDDFDDLVAREDRASRYAIAGDVLVGAGVVAAGIGAYFLLRRHDHAVALAPAPVAHGAGVTLTIVGGL